MMLTIRHLAINLPSMLLVSLLTGCSLTGCSYNDKEPAADVASAAAEAATTEVSSAAMPSDAEYSSAISSVMAQLGLASPREQDGSTGVAVHVQAARLPREGYDWKVWRDEVDEYGDRRVFLFYGEQQGDVDAAELRLLCLAGQGVIYSEALVQDRENQFHEMMLRTQQHSLILAASGPNDIGLVAAEAFSSHNQLLNEFAKEGGLTFSLIVSESGFSSDLVASTPAGKQAIVDFIDYCNSPVQ